MSLKNSSVLTAWVILFTFFAEGAHSLRARRRVPIVHFDIHEWQMLIQSSHQSYVIEMSDGTWHEVNSKEKFFELGRQFSNTRVTVIGYHVAGKMRQH